MFSLDIIFWFGFQSNAYGEIEKNGEILEDWKKLKNKASKYEYRILKPKDAGHFTYIFFSL